MQHLQEFQILRLIDLVKSFPPLYENTNPLFNHFILRQKIWKCIAKQLQTSGKIFYIRTRRFE